MFGFNTELAFLYAVFLFSLLSIFLTLWVVWHVEKKLDVSYKFFALAIIVFSVSILFEIFRFYNLIAAWHWEKIFKGGRYPKFKTRCLHDIMGMKGENYAQRTPVSQ